MNIGDTVVCISNNTTVIGKKLSLTLGKKYIIRGIEGNYFIHILNDNDVVMSYRSSYFKHLYEIREERINKIIKDGF